MPLVVECPSCGRKLSVPDELAGKQVRCADCAGTFVAEKPRASAPPPMPAPGPAPSRRSRDDDDDDDDRPSRRKRRGNYEAHRGGLILAFGIISLVGAMVFPVVIGLPLGIIAWMMGGKDLKKINAGQMDRFVKKIADTLWVLKDKKIGVLGLAFKQNTDDVRLSPAIDLCHRLQKEGAQLRVHDPRAMEKARAVLRDVTYVDDMNDVATGCDALVIATEWPEFKKLDLERARKRLSHPIMFDGRNMFDPQEMERLGFIYKSIGR